jgi:NlpC/P60 family
MAATAAQFIAEEKKFLGVPYVLGGASPSGFDCSGLVMYCLHEIGISSCPRTSEEQWQWSEHIAYDQLLPGDLVFEEWPGDDAAPGHVVTFIGSGQVIEAPETGQDVHVRSWSPAGDEADGAQIIGYGRVPGLQMTPEPPSPVGSVASGPVLYDPASGNLEVYAVGTNGHLLERAWNPHGWSDWIDLGGSVTGTPSVVFDPVSGNLEVYVRGAAGPLFQKAWNPAHGWSGWIDLGGAITGSPAALHDPTSGNLEVYAVGTDNALHEKCWNPAHGWSEWMNLQGSLTTL